MFHLSGLACSAVSMESIQIIGGAGESDSMLSAIAFLLNRHGDDCLCLFLVKRDKSWSEIIRFNQKVLKFLLNTLVFRMVKVDAGIHFFIASQIVTVLF